MNDFYRYFEDYIDAVTHSYAPVRRIAFSTNLQPDAAALARHYAGADVLVIDIWSMDYFEPLLQRAHALGRLWFFISEQATRTIVIKQARDFVRRFPRLRFLHYSTANIETMLRAGVSSAAQHTWVPFVSCTLAPSARPPLKTADVCFTGRVTERRARVLDALGNVTVVREWGAARDRRVGEHRVLLNVHQTDAEHRVLESLRCVPAAATSHTLVVSETSEPQTLSFIEATFVFAPYERLVATVRHVLANYALFYRQQRVRPFAPHEVEHCRRNFTFDVSETKR